MQAYESSNRRAEITGTTLTLFKLTGNVRRSKSAFWHVDITNSRKAARIARQWAMRGYLSKCLVGKGLLQ